ncbi:MAG: tRNA lysidine(34) synthetase TilS [Jatrophihabitantaceae bacterium]
MMGPHPALAEVRLAVRRALAALDGTVLVACSGGADSLALAAATAFETARAGRAAALVTVDHGLQRGSAGRAARVDALGYELRFDPVETVPVRVAGSGGPEAAARTARYAALDAVADSLDAHLLLGHTLDDQAETVLLGLGRGSGPRSVAGMRAVAGRHVRPLLGVRRASTEAACAALGLQPWRDPHNSDPAFQRARLRHEVLPLLEDVLHAGVAEALARTAAQLREDLDALDGQAAAALCAAAVDGALPVSALRALPHAVLVRVLRQWARSRGAAPLSAEHTGQLARLVDDWHGQGPLCLPGGLLVSRVSGRLEVHPPSHDLQE